jgi:hypothetical protein
MEAGRPAWHSRNVLYAAPILLLSVAGWGAVPANTAPPGEKEKSQAVKPTPVDAHAMVEALANRNPVPNLVKTWGCDPIFAKNFDWLENARAWDAFRSLIDHAEGTWHETVRHLDDGRYCITAYDGTENDYACNLTIGDACREIIVGSLTDVYLRHLQLDKMGYARMQMRDVTSDRKKLKAWCEARSTKSLHELQVETCRWAISELEKGGFGEQVPTSMRVDWIAAVKLEIESLKASKKAFHFHGFGESMEPYTRAKADEFRRKYATPRDRTAGKG